jgi:ABC-type Fe3+ transport system permease subunit
VTAWQWVWVYLIIACTWLVIAAIMAAVYWSYWAEQREKNYQKDKADESRRKFCNAVMIAALSPVWVIVTLTVLGVWVRAASREVGRAFSEQVHDEIEERNRKLEAQTKAMYGGYDYH